MPSEDSEYKSVTCIQASVAIHHRNSCVFTSVFLHVCVSGNSRTLRTEKFKKLFCNNNSNNSYDKSGLV